MSVPQERSSRQGASGGEPESYFESSFAEHVTAIIVRQTKEYEPTDFLASHGVLCDQTNKTDEGERGTL
jgi:hypothetical protein